MKGDGDHSREASSDPPQLHSSLMLLERAQAGDRIALYTRQRISTRRVLVTCRNSGKSTNEESHIRQRTGTSGRVLEVPSQTTQSMVQEAEEAEVPASTARLATPAVESHGEDECRQSRSLD